MVMEREKLSITVDHREDLAEPSKIHRFSTKSPSSPFFSLSTAFSKRDGGAGAADSTGSEHSSTDRKEHMFDKVVTPSDVGKLNRLVIPKQHAERCFPLDAAANEKGLILCFEDSDGRKAWRFRYSYWNSSQSYVMTKGWSRFVKDKRLNAGDTVSFSRGIGEDRFYIDWKRWRPDRQNFGSHRFSVRTPFAQPAWGSRNNYSVPSLAGNVVRASDSERQHLIYLGRPPALLRPQWTVPMIRRSKKVIRIFGVDLEYPEELQCDHVSNPSLQAVTTELQLLPQAPSNRPFQESSHGASRSAYFAGSSYGKFE